MTTLDTHLGV